MEEPPLLGSASPTERATRLIEKILVELAPPGRMIMLRGIYDRYLEFGGDPEEYAQALDLGQSLGLFSLCGLGLRRPPQDGT
jgi:hypothetical protein